MPRYDFACDDCHTRFERTLRVDARNDPQPCPVCRQSATRRPTAHGYFVFAGKKESPISAAIERVKARGL